MTLLEGAIGSMKYIGHLQEKGKVFNLESYVLQKDYDGCIE